MMLEYEWGNPAAAAAAMLLFGEETGPERQVFDHYGHHGGLPAGDLFAQQQHHLHLHQQQQQLSAAGLFTGSATGHQRYGLALPPASARIGLNLGVRTYFASGSPEEDLVTGRVCRRRTRMARCQAEGCGADLTHAKHYHRRHKVCEFHSKASIVIAAGLSQRFCQQCSRFHVLSEFDQGKRSCRKRLADHNRRRRKSQDLATTTATVTTHDNSTTAANTTTTILTTATTNNNDNTQNPEKVLFTTSSSSSSNNNNNRATTTPSFFTEPSSSVTRVSSPAPPALPSAAPRMALGLGCNNVVTVPPATGLSGSSSSGTSPPSVCFLSHLGDFRSHEHRFPSWDEAEDGSSIRELFQSK